MATQPVTGGILSKGEQSVIDIGYRLPEASVAEITGLLETLNAPENKGKMDLPVVAETLMLDIDELFPLT